jgi:hypothetical protein
MISEIARRLIGLTILIVFFLIGVTREKKGLKFGAMATIGFGIGFCTTLA